MKTYRITLISACGEPFVVTLAGTSLREVFSRIELDDGWMIAQCEEVF